jgi:muramoyltetrapeptide carboxypeptidase LdcA involved in peptidoglycan recycling
MRYPEFLKEGGSLGFVAPSFGCAIEPYHSAFKAGLEKFRQRGYKTVLGPNCFASEGVGISNKPELCGKELNEMYLSGETDVLLSCGGGELMCEVVPFIDWEAIRGAKPKWYMGYSDNTNFTFLSTILADTAAVYGPCAPGFGMEPTEEALKDAFQLLHGKTEVHNYPLWEKEGLKDEEHPLLPYNLTEAYRQRVFVPKTEAGDGGLVETDSAAFSGRLIGGCVDILVTLLGTRFDKTADFLERYRDDGFVWFLECCDLNPLSVRRAFFQMKHAGWFRYVKGFLIGRPLHFGEEEMGVDMYNAVTAVIGDLGVPVLMDLDIGHLPPMMPLISGAYGKVTAESNTLRIEQLLK